MIRKSMLKYSAVLLMAMAVACTNSKNGTIGIHPDSISVSWEGGECYVDIDVNPESAISDIEVSTQDSVWIVTPEVSVEESRVYFTVPVNDSGSKRSGSVQLVSQAYGFSGEFSVIQTVPEFIFDITVNGSDAEVSVVPDDRQIMYYISVFKNTGYSDNEIVQLVVNEFRRSVDMLVSEGKTEDEAIADLTLNGDYKKAYSLDPMCEYIAAVVAVSSTGSVSPFAVWDKFSTEGIPHPLVISVADIKPTQAKVTVETEEMYDYVLMLEKDDFWSDMTDEEVFAYLSDNNIDLRYFVRTGSVETLAERLTPDSDYVILSFGYSEGVVTSSLLRKNFRTNVNADTDARVDCVYDKYFDGTELEEKFPYDFFFASGHIVLPVEFFPVNDAVSYYYGLWSESQMDGMTDDEVIGWLLRDGEFYDTTAFYLKYEDGTYVLASVAIDSDGNLGDLKKESVNVTIGGISPIEEYGM